MSNKGEFSQCWFLGDRKEKREIRHFHVVVGQWRQRKCTKKGDASAKLLFCQSNHRCYGSLTIRRRNGNENVKKTMGQLFKRSLARV